MLWILGALALLFVLLAASGKTGKTGKTGGARGGQAGQKGQEPHWIFHNHPLDPDEYECSRCGAKFRKMSPACPACGARLTRVRESDDWIDEYEEADWLLEDDDD